MDTKIIENQIEGLIEKGKGLREKERPFLRVSGLDESIEKNRQEAASIEIDIAAKKEDLAELKSQKAEAVKGTLIAMQEKMTELLPFGDGIAHISDDRSFILGWMLPGKPLVPQAGLSGGQKVIFNQALGSALLGKAKEKMIIYEGAEVDEKNLVALLKQIAKTQDDNTQVNVNTWFKPKTVPKGWNLIELKG